jgi:hypothetical protein
MYFKANSLVVNNLAKTQLFCLMLTAAISLGTFNGVRAGILLSYVTGSDPMGEVVFKVTLDPTVELSAIVSVVARDSVRLDGIDYLHGSLSTVVTGAQFGGTGGIKVYDVTSGAILPSLVPDTGTPSKPSTVLSTASHVIYAENQFGFAGPKHRIMRTPIGGPPGTTETVFDGGSKYVNIEGLEIVGSRLFFHARDIDDISKRALYEITLAAGVSDGSPPIKRLGGLSHGAGMDGADEIDFDPTSGLLYGSNLISGEISYWDTVAHTGGFVISPTAISSAPMSSKLALLGVSELDGIRTTGDGYLVLTGLKGRIFSIDLAGVAAGLGDEDIRLLYDRTISGSGYSFDDLTPLTAVPEPSSISMFALASSMLLLTMRRRPRGYIH